MIKQFFLLLVYCLFAATTSAQLWSNPITGANPSTDNPFTTGDQVATGITVSGIGRGPGINANAGSDRYNAHGWNTAAADLDAYFSFTLTPDAGKTINFTTVRVVAQKSGTGPTSFFARSSVDAFTTDIGAISIPPSIPFTGDVEFDLSAFQNITSPITFRVYGYGASAANGTASINSFTFNGSVETSLPVTFESVDVLRNNNALLVKWTTANETNNDYFEVQAATDGKNFKTIQTIQSKNGNSNISQQYETWIDISAMTPLLGVSLLLGAFGFKNGRRKKHIVFAGILLAMATIISCSKHAESIYTAKNEKVFIRIKQVDLDGKAEYSKTIQVINE